VADRAKRVRFRQSPQPNSPTHLPNTLVSRVAGNEPKSVQMSPIPKNSRVLESLVVQLVPNESLLAMRFVIVPWIDEFGCRLRLDITQTAAYAASGLGLVYRFTRSRAKKMRNRPAAPCGLRDATRS
jgi:hypothetical protein